VFTKSILGGFAKKIISIFVAGETNKFTVTSSYAAGLPDGIF
jgi:hypothetical protein